MNKAIAPLYAIRNNISKVMAGLTDEQLNHVPTGFNNNLIWNAGHVVATMELLVYALSGHHTPSDKVFIDKYRKGSKPEGPVSAEEIAAIKGLLASSLEKLEGDLPALQSSDFKTYQTSFGVELNSLRDALSFNGFHEAMHLGTMIALRKLV